MSAPSQFQASQPVPSATYAGWDAITQQQPLWTSAGGVPPTPVGTSGNGGINGVGGQLPANTNTTPLVSFTFEAGATPTSANVTASTSITNSSGSTQTYAVYLWAGATQGSPWGVVTIPTGGKMVVSPSRYFDAITGSTTINFLINSNGGGPPSNAELYSNPTILAVWGGV